MLNFVRFTIIHKFKSYLPFEVGIWHDVTGINFFRNFTETYSEIVESLQNKTLVVTTIMVSIERDQTKRIEYCLTFLIPVSSLQHAQRIYWEVSGEW